MNNWQAALWVASVLTASFLAPIAAALAVRRWDRHH